MASYQRRQRWHLNGSFPLLPVPCTQLTHLPTLLHTATMQDIEAALLKQDLAKAKIAERQNAPSAVARNIQASKQAFWRCFHSGAAWGRAAR